MIYELDENEISFPDPSLAFEDGILAFGGDLKPERLILAYQNGIFPWYNEDEPIFWYSPHQRCVIYPDKLKVSKSLAQVLRNGNFKVTVDKAFDEVMRNCAKIYRKGQDGTWITAEMQKAYVDMHKLGWAHSVEVWQKEKLVGGLYGILIGDVFCGESMFSLVSNASKVALTTLCRETKVKLIDCQMPNDHLLSLGAEMIDSEVFMRYLKAQQ